MNSAAILDLELFSSNLSLSRTELDELIKPIAGLIIAGFLIVVAIAGKVITGWTVFGLPNINRLARG